MIRRAILTTWDYVLFIVLLVPSALATTAIAAPLFVLIGPLFGQPWSRPMVRVYMTWPFEELREIWRELGSD